MRRNERRNASSHEGEGVRQHRAARETEKTLAASWRDFRIDDRLIVRIAITGRLSTWSVRRVLQHQGRVSRISGPEKVAPGFPVVNPAALSRFAHAICCTMAHAPEAVPHIN